MAVIIAGTTSVAPDDVEAATAALVAMMAETAKEAGCVSYTFSRDLSEPGVFHLFEEWESPEHLAAHMTTPHMAALGEAMKGLSVTGRNLSRYDDVPAAQPL